jgi:hypothetical protein
MRLISHSEVDRLLGCSLAWDFAYGGTLTGHTLQPLIPHYYLRRGKAWGGAWQAWHETGDLGLARLVLHRSLEMDAEEQMAAGQYDEAEHIELEALLFSCIEHYAHHALPLELSSPERRLVVPIPGVDASLDMRLDGVAINDDGLKVPVEAKLRKSLSSFGDVLRWRQPRWYAWGIRETYDVDVRGFIIDERLAETPPEDAPVKINKGREVSKVQSCTPLVYRSTCTLLGETPDPEVLERLEKKHDPTRYHARHVISFTPDELDEAGREIKSAAEMIIRYDHRWYYPMRNPSYRCNSCAFREVCLDPKDVEVNAALYRLGPPKYLRPEEDEPHANDPSW